MPRRQFVVPTLAGQQWPEPASACAIEARPIVFLPIPVVIVAIERWTDGSLATHECIDDFYRIDDEWIVGASNAIANELEKSGIDYFFRGILNPLTEWLILKTYDCTFHILT